MDDFTDGTFTVSAMDHTDIVRFTPIIHPKQSAVLAIPKIQQKVMIDAAAGLLSSTIAYDTTISNDTGTTMTGNDATGQAYFNVWKGSVTDKVKEDQLKQVILHFEAHGYTIYRNTNATITTIFDWKIEW